MPFVLLAAWARLASPAAWEPELMLALALGVDAWAEVVRGINTLGSLVPWAVVVAGVAIAFGRLRGVAAGLLVGLSYAADLLAFGVKLVVERARPETAAEHFLGADSFAFPSGHVVRAVALAAVVGWLLAAPRWRVRVALGAATAAWLVMGYARVALGVHWPTDTMGGALLGVTWFAVTAAILRSRI